MTGGAYVYMAGAAKFRPLSGGPDLAYVPPVLTGMLIGARVKAQASTASLSTQFVNAQANMGTLQMTRVFYGTLPSKHTRITPKGTLEVISFKHLGSNVTSFVNSLTDEKMVFYHEPEGNYGGTYGSSGGAQFVSDWTAARNAVKAVNPSQAFGMIAGGYQYNVGKFGYSGSYLPSNTLCDFYCIDTYCDGSHEPPGFGGITGLPNVDEFQRWYSLANPKGKPLYVTEYGRGTVGSGEVADAPAERDAILASDMQWLRDHGFKGCSFWYSDAGPDNRDWRPPLTETSWYTTFKGLARGAV